MKRIAVVLTLVLASAVTATHTTHTMPQENPRYGEYVQTHSYKRSAKFTDAVKRFRYQQAQSPYLLVRSPYGTKPWNKPYGDEAIPSLYKPVQNPFYGFDYTRQYVCDSPTSCSKRNVFVGTTPGSPKGR